MRTLEGTYRNGRVRLSKKPRLSKPVDVTVIFHPPSPASWRGLSGRQLRKLFAIVDLGGNGLEDTEQLYS